MVHDGAGKQDHPRKNERLAKFPQQVYTSDDSLLCHTGQPDVVPLTHPPPVNPQTAVYTYVCNWGVLSSPGNTHVWRWGFPAKIFNTKKTFS